MVPRRPQSSALACLKAFYNLPSAITPGITHSVLPMLGSGLHGSPWVYGTMSPALVQSQATISLCFYQSGLVKKPRNQGLASPFRNMY